MGEFIAEFAARLKQARKDRGGNAADFAKRLGISPPTLYAWEEGRYQPPLEKLPLLAEVYGLTIGELVGLPLGLSLPEDIQAMYAECPDKKEVLQAFRMLLRGATGKGFRE